MKRRILNIAVLVAVVGSLSSCMLPRDARHDRNRHDPHHHYDHYHDNGYHNRY